MNARQKAKKLKQELEFYKRMMVPVKCVKESHEIWTYRYKNLFDKRDPFERNYIIKKTMEEAKLHIPDYMIATDICDNFNPDLSEITATIQVVNPNV